MSIDMRRGSCMETPIESTTKRLEVHQKKSFLAVAAAFTALAIASQASAADLAAPTAPVYSKAPEYVQRQVSNWTGFYVGGDVGGIFQNGDGSSNFSSTTPELILFERPALASPLAGPLAVDDTRGFSSSKGAVSGGVHAGYNYQFAPNFLVGIEADWQATGIRNSACRAPIRPQCLVPMSTTATILAL